MARSDGDTWDLASGVGATATAVATSRALATRIGLIEDRWAEPLVRAVGAEHFLGILQHPDGPPDQQRMTMGMAVRTRFFDDFLARAGEAGIRQAVILASGLDARAYRLGWPAGTVVFDVDQQAVIDFKTATLAGLGAEPTADVRGVGVDLRADWPAALSAHDFDAARPTAWIAEGLLMYLPPDAQDRLFDHITALSPPGSRLATEFFPSMDAFTTADDRWRRFGFSDDLAGLVYAGERSHAVEYLRGLGWEVTSIPVRDLFDTYGIERQVDETSEQFDDFQYLTAGLG